MSGNMTVEGANMSDIKKVSKAQSRATAKYEKKAYFKTLVRFKAKDEEIIRKAAGESLNGFIVSAVMEKIARDKSNQEKAAELDK